MSAVLPIFCFICFLTQLHCAFCFHWQHYSRSRLLFLEMMLSVLSIWNFFHFNVTASNFESFHSIEIYSNTFSITEPVYCDRLLVGPYHSAITYIVTSDHFLLHHFLMVVMTEVPFIYFCLCLMQMACHLQHYNIFVSFSPLSLLLKFSWAILSGPLLF